MRHTIIHVWALALICVIWLALVAFALPALGAEHRGHRPQDMELHKKFYSTWMLPDRFWIPCCYDQDCQPAASKFEDGSWWAKWDDMQKWVEIPAEKIEENRDSPDGRSHMCGRQSWLSESGFDVFCFVRGGGA
jgi:hypothetical protein